MNITFDEIPDEEFFGFNFVEPSEIDEIVSQRLKILESIADEYKISLSNWKLPERIDA